MAELRQHLIDVESRTSLELSAGNAEKAKTGCCSSISPDSLRPLVFGGLDGLVTTITALAVAYVFHSGVAGAYRKMFVTAAANCIGDAVSMGLGGFIADDAERSKLQTKKDKVITRLQNREARAQLLTEYSAYLTEEKEMSEDDAQALVNLYSKYPDMLSALLVQREFGEEAGEVDTYYDLLNSAKTMFFSFIGFGSLPLLPLLFCLQLVEITPLFFVGGFTLLSFFTLGYAASVQVSPDDSSLRTKFIFKISGQGLFSIAIAVIIAFLFEELLSRLTTSSKE
jgi:VIT1/CCC1 family predicted Fe2+/Mn2+ transporter